MPALVLVDGRDARAAAAMRIRPFAGLLPGHARDIQGRGGGEPLLDLRQGTLGGLGRLHRRR